MPEPGYYYRDGLAVLREVRESPPPWMDYDPRLEAHVAPGHRYPELRAWAETHPLPEISRGPDALEDGFADARTPRDYQVEALARWDAAGRRGTVVLPTGAGKSRSRPRAPIDHGAYPLGEHLDAELADLALERRFASEEPVAVVSRSVRRRAVKVELATVGELPRSPDRLACRG